MSLSTLLTGLNSPQVVAAQEKAKKDLQTWYKFSDAQNAAYNPVSGENNPYPGLTVFRANALGLPDPWHGTPGQPFDESKGPEENQAASVPGGYGNYYASPYKPQVAPGEDNGSGILGSSMHAFTHEMLPGLSIMAMAAGGAIGAAAGAGAGAEAAAPELLAGPELAADATMPAAVPEVSTAGSQAGAGAPAAESASTPSSPSTEPSILNSLKTAATILTPAMSLLNMASNSRRSSSPSGTTPSAPKVEPPTVLPDSTSGKTALSAPIVERDAIRTQLARRGRASTILTSGDKLGS